MHPGSLVFPLPDATAGARPGTVRFLANPGDELLHVGVGSQGFERVVLAFQLLVVEDGVYVPVAGRAETDREVNLPPVEGLLIALVLVARPGDEVMTGRPLHLPATEFAGSSPCAAFRLVHVSMLAAPLPVASETVRIRRNGYRLGYASQSCPVMNQFVASRPIMGGTTRGPSNSRYVTS